ncbi:type VI secretion protein IcmF, partial [Vibrio parahaemolyticus V-223/04]
AGLCKYSVFTGRRKKRTHLESRPKTGRSGELCVRRG